MQTFLPYSSFEMSAKCLDYRRLGKQRVEAMQILRTLRGETEGWASHPATRMWRGYEDALAHYLNCVLFEWVCRGYKNSIALALLTGPLPSVVFPKWLGDVDFHKAHQSNLLRKDPDFYSFDVPDDLPYIWPDQD